MNKLKKAVAALAIVGFVGMFAAPASAAVLDNDSDWAELLILSQLFSGGVGTSGYINYTIQSGDTLSGIAQRFLGDSSRFDELADLNDIADPDLIYAGDVLRIPSTSVMGNTNLGALIALSLFDDNGIGGDNNDLTSLLVLSQLFGSGNMNNGVSGNIDLESLIVLEALSEDGIGGDSSLGALIALDAFNQGSGFFSGDINIGDLIILEELFND